MTTRSVVKKDILRETGINQLYIWLLDLVLEFKSETILWQKKVSIRAANSEAVTRWSHPGNNSLLEAASLACKEIPREV